MFPCPKIILSLLFVFAAARLAAGEVIRTVVIDPGHGGKDPGCVYGQYKEKEIVLDVAKRLGKLINQNYPSVKVVYTRSTDVFIELHQRGRIANKAGADLFLSIHVNAIGKGKTASGTETFIMGVAKSAANLDVAMRENDVIKYEDDAGNEYQGYQPGSAESFIMFNLMQYAYREQSLAIAREVQQRYSKNVSIPNRGVKEAGILVLWRTAMPAILTEMGFITNSADRKHLITAEGRQMYARCLFDAFSAYKTRTESGSEQFVATEIAETGAAAGQTAGSSAGQAAEPSGAQGAVSASESPQIVFAVQIATSSKSLSPNDPRFGEYRGKVFEKKADKLYKYYVAECGSYREACAAQSLVRSTVKDAFVVAFRNGKPISVSEALKLVKE